MNIFNLIKIDLSKLPNAKCVNMGTEKNSSGGNLTKYQLLLDEKEMDLFETLEIIVFETGEKRYIFKDFDQFPEILNGLDLLVMQLWSIYGEDIHKKGILAKDDIELIEIGGVLLRTFNVKYPQVYLSYSLRSGIKLAIFPVDPHL